MIWSVPKGRMSNTPQYRGISFQVRLYISTILSMWFDFDAIITLKRNRYIPSTQRQPSSNAYIFCQFIIFVYTNLDIKASSVTWNLFKAKFLKKASKKYLIYLIYSLNPLMPGDGHVCRRSTGSPLFRQCPVARSVPSHHREQNRIIVCKKKGEKKWNLHRN